MADNPTTTVVIPQSTTENPYVKPVILRLPNTANPVWHWIASALIAVLSLIASGFFAYQHGMENVQNRLITVETQQKDGDNRLDRIEAKIDKLVDHLIGQPPTQKDPP